jgi:hypothetical protein
MHTACKGQSHENDEINSFFTSLDLRRINFFALSGHATSNYEKPYENTPNNSINSLIVFSLDAEKNPPKCVSVLRRLCESAFRVLGVCYSRIQRF